MSDHVVKSDCFGEWSSDLTDERKCAVCVYKGACVDATEYIATTGRENSATFHPNHEDSQRRLNDLAMNQVKAVYAKDTQVGGTHYKDLPIQPVEYIHANAIGYFEGNVIKYVSRWRKKNGVADLEKAKHYIELLIELESKK